MKNKKSAASLILLWLVALLLPFFGEPARAVGEEAQHFTYANEISVLLIGDPVTGKVLFEKNIDEKKPVASMSKLMTYYIVEKKLQEGAIRLDDVVTVSKEAAALHRPDYSNYGLVEGEKRSVEQLLRGLMVVSGNDAAVALAEHIAGSSRQFAELMNETAQSLELSQSHFVNPHGLTEGSGMNEMSARDLFVLSSHILNEFPQVRDYSTIHEIKEPERSFEGKATMTDLLQTIPGLNGLKTGMTEEAGYCFTASVDLSKYDKALDFDIVAIVMGCPTSESRWRTTKELVDFSAGSFRSIQVVDANLPYGPIQLPEAEKSNVMLYPAESFSTITYQQARFDIQYEVYDRVPLPAKAGDAFGEIRIQREGMALKKIPLVVKEPVQKASIFNIFTRGFERLMNLLGRMLG